MINRTNFVRQKMIYLVNPYHLGNTLCGVYYGWTVNFYRNSYSHDHNAKPLEHE